MEEFSMAIKRKPTRETRSPFESMTAEEAADWRTRTLGNEGFEGRERSFAESRVGVAVGDSWFNYLPARLALPSEQAGDILDCLNDSGKFNILRTAEPGDTVEDMIWGTDYWTSNWKPRERRQITDAVALIERHHPNFFLFSGGGDDIAGTPLQNYLNHVAYGGEAGRRAFLDFLMTQYLKAGYQTMIAAVRQAKGGLPIFIHGYDYPVADGRGVINGPFGFHYLGPWLRPAFAMKRTVDSDMVRILTDLIDHFNNMLGTLHDPAHGVYYLNLRGLLKMKLYPDGAYKKGWTNELHPTNKGFKLIADTFAKAIIKATR
jgi:hypothetical protein